MASLPIIRGNRVLLRELVLGDVDAIYEIFSDAQVMRYWSTPPLPNKAAAENLLNRIIGDVQRGAIMKWGIARTTDDLVMGTATLFNLSLENGRAEIGYALGREHWGQGLMNEALHTLLQHSFETMKLRRLEADVDPRNHNSIRTLERLGFQREGYLRERWHVAGEIQDALFYGLLKREWKQMSDML